MADPAERSGLPQYTLDDAKRLAGEIEMLRRVGALISRLEVDEAEIFRDLVAVVRSRFRADRVTLVLAEPDSNDVLVIDGDKLGRARTLPVARVPADDSPFTPVIRNKRSILVTNRAELDQVSPLARYLKAEGVKSVVAVPLIASRAAIGVLALGSEVALTFQIGDVSTLELIGNLVGSVVENVRLFARVSNARRETQAVFDHFAEPIAVVDPEGRVIRVNRAMRDLVGGDYTDILGRPCTEVLSATELRGGHCAHAGVFKTGKPTVREIVTGDGSVLEVHVGPLDTHDGRVDKVVHVVRNLTRDRAALAESARLRVALDHVTDGVLFIGTDGAICMANAAIARILGVLMGSLVGRPFVDVLRELGFDDAEAVDRGLDAAAPAPWEGWIEPEGRSPLRFHVQPVEEDERVQGFLVVLSPDDEPVAESELV